jgi:hypothetical protein
LWGFDLKYNPTIYGIVYINTNDTGLLFEPKYTSEEDSIWAIRGGQRPPSTPICGFSDICVLSPLVVTGISVGSIVLFASILMFLLALIYICQRQERERLNALWNIDFANLMKREQTVSL